MSNLWIFGSEPICVELRSCAKIFIVSVLYNAHSQSVVRLCQMHWQHCVCPMSRVSDDITTATSFQLFMIVRLRLAMHESQTVNIVQY